MLVALKLIADQNKLKDIQPAGWVVIACLYSARSSTG